MNLRQVTRATVTVGTILWPWVLRRLVLRHVLGWTIEPGASIGLSLVASRAVHLGRESRIGHFNVIRDLNELHLGNHALVGQWNWITAAPSLAGLSGGYLRVGEEAAITSRHYIDCSGGVTIGHHSTIAGVRSVIMSHQIDVAVNVQSTAPVIIGDFVLASSNVKIAPGTTIPSECVLAMGTVAIGTLPEEGVLYAGVPARVKRRGINAGAYFRRREGVVESPRASANRADRASGT